MMSDDPWPPTRDSIIGRLKNADDQEAWTLVVEIYTPLVLRYCVSRGLQQADACDVTQEVLTKLQSFEYQPQRGKFRAWLGTVARNQVALFYRRQTRKADSAGLDQQAVEPDLDWERIYHTHILDKAIERIRDEFSADTWIAFQKVALTVKTEGDHKTFQWNREGSPQRVANELNRTVAWVYKIKSKVLQRLRDEILFLADELAILEG